jgi:hypothetical protein
MNHIILERGKPYPLPITINEGAAAQFLIKGGSILQVRLPEMTAAEEWALRNGLLKAGLLAANGAILLLFQFYDKNGRPSLTLDCPFDLRLVPPEKRQLHDIESGAERLLFEVHAVDENNILRGLRAVTLPAPLTLAFFSAVQDQLASSLLGDAQHAAWQRREPVEICATVDMQVCGR